MAEIQHDCLTSVEETSKRLGVSSFTVRRLIKIRQLHAVRVGNRVLVPMSEIDRVMREGYGKHVAHA